MGSSPPLCVLPIFLCLRRILNFGQTVVQENTGSIVSTESTAGIYSLQSTESKVVTVPVLGFKFLLL